MNPRLLMLAAALTSPAALLAQQSATDQPIGLLETVATFPGPMPEGVTVSRANRIFVNFARWGDDIPFTVAEIVQGKAVAYPNAEINNWPGRSLPNPNAFTDERANQTHFVSVQSVVVDAADHLWVLDTGAPRLKNTVPGGPKLVCIDLATNRVLRTILITQPAAGTNTYLNDVRFDLRVGDTGPQDPQTMIGSRPAPNPNVPPPDPSHPAAERSPGTDPAPANLHGTAYITDSSSDGPNAIIVVDLATGKSWRHLNQHSSVLGEDGFLMFAEGRPSTRPNPANHPSPSSSPPTASRSPPTAKRSTTAPSAPPSSMPFRPKLYATVPSLTPRSPRLFASQPARCRPTASKPTPPATCT